MATYGSERQSMALSSARQVAHRRFERQQVALLEAERLSRAEQAWHEQHGRGPLGRFVLPGQLDGAAVPPTQGHYDQLRTFAAHVRDHQADHSRSPVDVASPARALSPVASDRILRGRVVKPKGDRRPVSARTPRRPAPEHMQWHAGSPSMLAPLSPASHTAAPTPAAFSPSAPSPAQSEYVFAVSTPRPDARQSEEQPAAATIWLRVFREHGIAKGAFGEIFRAEVRQ